MPVDDSVRINIYHFLETQQKERFNAFVIYGLPLSQKTTFAKKLVANFPNAYYIDTLKHVVANPPLAQQIDLFDVASLREIILTYSLETQADLLLVDEIDFLLPIWGDDLTELKQFITSLSKTETKTVTGFILQTHPALEGWTLLNSVNENRILQLELIRHI